MPRKRLRSAGNSEGIPQRPITSSLFTEVYRRMPNDTDFSVTKAVAPGVNFANLARVAHYHTPLDTTANLDSGTLQHHGDQALAMARAYADVVIDEPPTGPATWFDVLGLWVVRWPASWSMPIAVVALVFVAVQALRMYAWGWGLLAAPATLGAAGASAFAVGAAMRAAGALPAPWIAHPLPALISLHAAAVAGGGAAAILLARRTTPRSLWGGVWLGWAALGVAAASLAPGASYLFSAPALTAAVFAPLPFRAAYVVPIVAAAVVWGPLTAPLYEALGLGVPALAAVASVLLVSALAPLLAGLPRKAPLPLAATSLLSAVVTVAAPTFSREQPQRVNVVHRQDEDGAARVFVDASWGWRSWGSPPPAMVRALGARGRVRAERAFGWSLPAPSAEAERVGAAPPAAEVVSSSSEGGRRRVKVRVRSPRGAPTLLVELPRNRAVNVRFEGLPATPRAGVLTLRGVPGAGAELELDAAGPEPIEVKLSDMSYDLPVAGLAREVAGARPPEAVPSQDGDVTVVARRARL